MKSANFVLWNVSCYIWIANMQHYMDNYITPFQQTYRVFNILSLLRNKQVGPKRDLCPIHGRKT